MRTDREYIRAMNQLDKKLDVYDKEYFAKLREYMNETNIITDKKAVNEQIYQMYLDFMNAQDEGLNAFEFFGDEPKQMADSILEDLPKTPLKNFLALTILLANTLWSLRLVTIDFMYSYHSDVLKINLLAYLFDLVIGLITTFLIMKYVRKRLYTNFSSEDYGPSEENRKFLIGIVVIILLTSLLIVIGSNEFLPNILTVAIPFPWDIVLAIIISALALIANVLINSPFRDFVLNWVIVFNTITILNRLEAENIIELSGVSRAILIICLAVLSLRVERKIDFKKK